MVWPFALIIAGILFFFKPSRDKRAKWARHHAMHHQRNLMGMKMKQSSSDVNIEGEQQQSDSVDGFLRSENVWGAARHVVLDELFRGAEVRTSFGGTTIDLRHTHIVSGEKFMCLPIGKLCLNVMRFLAGVMTNVGKMGMLTKIVY